jgi:hypothetical protein
MVTLTVLVLGAQERDRRRASEEAAPPAGARLTLKIHR